MQTHPARLLTLPVTLAAFCAVSAAVSLAHADTYYHPYYPSYSGYSHYAPYGAQQEAPIISLDLDDKDVLNTSFRIAAREDRVADMKHLLQQGADVNSRSSAGDTALIDASRNCALKTVDELLTINKIDVNIKNQEGRTAIMYAAMDSCLPAVERLLRHPEIDVTHRDRDGKTALDYAMDNSEIDLETPATRTTALLRRAVITAQHRARKLRLAHHG